MKLVSSEKRNIKKNKRKAGAVNKDTYVERNAPPANRNVQPYNRNISPVNGNISQENKNQPNRNVNQPNRDVTSSPVVPPGNRNIPPPQEKPPKRISPVKTIIIILLIIIIGAAALFVSLGFYVDSLDTVLPNVWAEGIEVSGLTFEEAVQRLIDEGYESNADNISVTINFPDETGFTFSGVDVGLSLNAADAARKAFEFGRKGTFFENLMSYINSVLERTDLHDLSAPVFDDAIMHTLVSEYTGKYNDTIIDGSLEEGDNHIEIVKGMGLRLIDEEAVYNLTLQTLTSAVEANTHMTAALHPSDDDENNTELQIAELERLFSRIHLDARSVEYEIDIEAENYVNITRESTEGRTFDLEAAIEKLENAQFGETVVIDFITLYPEIVADDIKGKIFRDVLAERRTNIGGTSNRISNVVLAARYIQNAQDGNGYVLMPGETFSFNEVVGRRSAERGFLMAPGFRGGQLEDMSGGGICQTASTIYAAVLLTYLEVVERHQHGMRVAYLPEGEDSAISYGAQDLKFKNNTDYPIRIEIVGSIANKTLSVKLVGTIPDDHDDSVFFKIVQRNRVEIEMTRQTIESDVDGKGNPLYIGQTAVRTGFMGVRVDIWREYYNADGSRSGAPNYDDLVKMDRRISRNNFRMVSQITWVGTRVPETVPDPGGGEHWGGDPGVGEPGGSDPIEN